MADIAPTEQQRRARDRLAEGRDSIRRERAELMARMGRELRAWREGGGIKQQDLAAQGCVSATVVRNIEKGSYESAPHPSLVSAVGRLGGPARELRELAAAYRTLQGKQRRVDRLLSRKEVPESAGWLDGEGEQPGLRPAVSSRPPSLFVGRRDELTALARALASQRLITVVGPGGIGKTALCVRFAGSLPRPLAGPWFTDLSRVEAGKPVLPVLADLILDDAGDTGDNAEVVARLGAVLADTPALIILDNCEHVLAAAATAVMRILTACPGVRFLATSREPLHLPDEWVMTVGPLPVANRDGLGGWPASEPGDAVELFVRLLGQARGEESELSSAEVAEVAELCRALDGVPLCIELAAARARTLPVRDIAASVGRGPAILSGGRREIPRHQAIEATISWSWDLLGPDEQRALSRLAILTAPFTFRCGAGVAHGEFGTGERLVAALADKSLISWEMGEPGDARFKVLGVVRNFALRHLSPADRQHATRQLMCWALDISQMNKSGLQHSAAIERIDKELPLIRVALEAGEESPADQVRLAAAMWQYWHIRSLSAYACQFLARARDEETPLTLAERSRALGNLANLLAYQGCYTESIDAAQQSVRAGRVLGDPPQLRHSLLTLLGCLIEARRFDEADPCLTEIAAIPGPVELSAIGDLNVRRGLLCLHRGDPRRAIRLLTEAGRCFHIEGMTLAHGFCLGYLSVAQRRAGDLDASLKTALEARQILGGTFGPGSEAEVTVGQAAAYLALGRQEDALVALDDMPADEQIRPQTRVHALVLRAMAASVAAAFLLSHVAEFAGGSDEQTMMLIRATQEIAYRSASYENAALLRGVLVRAGTVIQDVEVGLPVFKSSRFQGHLSEPDLEALTADGFNTDPHAAFHLAVTALAELASDRGAPLPRRSAPEPPATFGTRLMLIAPHSPSPS